MKEREKIMEGDNGEIEGCTYNGNNNTTKQSNRDTIKDMER